MIAILTTHPIQYQVPLWRALANEGNIPFEVWFLTDHGTRVSHDPEFNRAFAWDLNMLEGYPHRFLRTPDKATPKSFWRCCLRESLAERILMTGTSVVWVQGWQVAAYWQAVWAAKRAGAEVWLRGESNDLAPVPCWKRGAKRLLLRQLFRRVDHFLYIGAANRRFYEKYGVAPSHLHPGFYSVDNERFARQARSLVPRRTEIRRQWDIPSGAFCILFCGKFVPKKRPHDVISAARRLIETDGMNVHLLFVGSGELGDELRRACDVISDVERDEITRKDATSHRPAASFTGFLNQTEVCEAYVAADCLVLPSDYGETWGLVVNEAMAAGLPCILSDRCGASEDLADVPAIRIFECGDIAGLANQLADLSRSLTPIKVSVPERFSFATTISTVARLSSTRRRSLAG